MWVFSSNLCENRYVRDALTNKTLTFWRPINIIKKLHLIQFN